MTQPAPPPPAPVAAPAAPAPAANAAPPVAPAAAEQPQTAPARPAPATRRRIGGGETRAYGTKPAAHALPLKAAPAPATDSVARPGPTTPEASASAAAPAQAANPAAEPTSSGAPHDTTPAPPPEPEAAPKLTDAEFSKRVNHLNRQSKELATQRQAFAAERQQFVAERGQALQRLQIVEQAAQSAKQNPLEFMHRALGVSPQQILDAIIADGAVPAATKAQQQQAREADELRAKIAHLESAVQTSAQQQAQRAHEERIAAFKAAQIAPLFGDGTKYELTLRALGPRAADECFDLIAARHRVTKGAETLTPAQAAERIESHFRSQRDLLVGTNVAPGQPPKPSPRTEPAPAPASGSQTPPSAPARRGAYAPPVKSYSVQAKR